MVQRSQRLMSTRHWKSILLAISIYWVDIRSDWFQAASRATPRPPSLPKEKKQFDHFTYLIKPNIAGAISYVFVVWFINPSPKSRRVRNNQGSEWLHEHSLNGGMNCRALINWASNPDVISMPMHAGKSKKYNVLRFDFLYHGTLSSSTIFVRMGSDNP